MGRAVRLASGAVFDPRIPTARRDGIWPPKPRKKPVQHERTLQEAIVAYHARCVIEPHRAILHAIPNGEKRDWKTARLLAGSLKSRALDERAWDLEEDDIAAMRPGGLGVLAGVADLQLLLPGPRAVLIETKRAANKALGVTAGALSKAQQRFRRFVTELGFEYVKVNSVDDYDALLRRHGVKLRSQPLPGGF